MFSKRKTMRPDEHKKKKNAEYKKKHGIPAKKESKKEEKKKGESEKPEKKQENAGKEIEKKQGMKEARSFSRRKVTSNWDRYEELECKDNDTDQPKGRRGEDFATLVERVGDSHSQFRFQAEKEWEDESIGVQETQEVLKLNLEDLTQALKSLPLHKKLNLEEKDMCLDPQELEYDQKTEIKEMLKCIDIQDEGPVDISQESASASQKCPSLLSDKTEIKSDVPRMSKSCEDLKSNSNIHQSMKNLSNESSLMLNRTAVTGTLYSMGVIKSTDQLDDKELDFLLSLDTGHSRSLSPLKNESEVPDNLQTDSENTDIDVGDTPKASSLSDTKSEKSSGSQKPKEDLEDWLDSVLG